MYCLINICPKKHGSLKQIAEEEGADVDSKFRSLVAIGSLVSSQSTRVLCLLVT